MLASAKIGYASGKTCEIWPNDYPIRNHRFPHEEVDHIVQLCRLLQIAIA
jgi:hypothetical protein